MYQHGPWKIVKSYEVYRDAWLDLRWDEVIRPDGLPGTYSTVRLKPGVCVIAIDSEEHVCLTKEFHYAVGRETLEGVSGGVEEDESPETAAARELEEELGIRASHWVSMGSIDPFTASVTSPTRLYVAGGLHMGEASREGTECIEMVRISLDDALQAIDRSEITHAPTCILLLKLALLRHTSNDLPTSLGFS